MHPILAVISLFGKQIYIYSYAVCVFVGMGLGTYIFIRTARWLGMPDRVPEKLAAILVTSAFVGARAIYVFQHPDRFNTFWAVINPMVPGMGIFGGLLLMLISGLSFSLINKIKVADVLDSITMALWPGIAIIRIGCFMAGCCFGKVTSSFWGVIFPTGTMPYMAHLKQGLVKMFESSLPVYPTQLFEMAAVFLIGAMAYLILRSNLRSGSASAVFFAYYSVFRVFNANLRFDGLVWYYPYIYLTVIVFSLLLLIWVNFFHRTKSH